MDNKSYKYRDVSHMGTKLHSGFVDKVYRFEQNNTKMAKIKLTIKT